MTDVLLPLSIAVPIVAATLPLALGLRYEDAGWPVAAVTTLGLIGSAAAVALEVYTAGPFDHELGGYAPPIGIELVADELSAAVFLLVALVSAATLVLSREIGPRGNAFHSAYLLLTGGLVGVSLTGDLFNLFVFLEIVGLTTYALIAADRSGASAYASLKYLVVGTVGASLYLVGVGYTFLATGTLNMADVSVQIVEQASYTDPMIRAGYAFIVVGFALKIALFPVHSWQPDAYQRAPDSVTTVVAALVSTVSAYALVRVTYSVFTLDFLAANDAITTGILLVAGVSILAGSGLAVMQSDLKRMFAYSSVAQFGMVAAAVGIADETALLGGVVHLVGHGLMKFGLFCGLALLAAGYGAHRVEDLASLAREAPFASGALAVLGLSLVGIPPSVGFLGKWYIALGAVRSAGATGGVVGIGLAAVILASTLFTLAYVARVIEQLSCAGVDREDLERGDVAAGHADGPDRDAGDAVADGGDATAAGTAPTAPLVVLVVTALVVVGLGFAGAGFESLLDPYLSEVFA